MYLPLGYGAQEPYHHDLNHIRVDHLDPVFSIRICCARTVSSRSRSIYIDHSDPVFAVRICCARAVSSRSTSSRSSRPCIVPLGHVAQEPYHFHRSHLTSIARKSHILIQVPLGEHDLYTHQVNRVIYIRDLFVHYLFHNIIILSCMNIVSQFFLYSGTK